MSLSLSEYLLLFSSHRVRSENIVGYSECIVRHEQSNETNNKCREKSHGVLCVVSTHDCAQTQFNCICMRNWNFLMLVQSPHHRLESRKDLKLWEHGCRHRTMGGVEGWRVAEEKFTFFYFVYYVRSWIKLLQIKDEAVRNRRLRVELSNKLKLNTVNLEDTQVYRWSGLEQAKSGQITLKLIVYDET